METFHGNFVWGILKFETYQEFMGINWKFGEIYKAVSYTNININILFDHRLNTHANWYKF